MRLNRVIVTGLALLIVGGGTGLTVNEVKEREIKANQERYNKELNKLSQRVDFFETNYKQARDMIVETNSNLQKAESQIVEIEDKNKALEDELSEVKADYIDLKKRLDEPKSVTVSRGEQRKGITMTVNASAYTPYCAGCSGETSTGINVRNSITHNGYGIVATDPSVIPLGSIVIINDKYYLAADKGGAIKGNKIDVLVRTKEEAIQFGRKNIQVTVIRR